MFFAIMLVIGVILNIVVFCIMVGVNKWRELELELDRHNSISFLKTITIFLFLPAYLLNFICYWFLFRVIDLIDGLAEKRLSTDSVRNFMRCLKPRIPFRRC